MRNPTRRKLVGALAIGLSIVLLSVAAYHIRQAVLFARLSEPEKKIVGAWSWTYIEGVGRMVFTADHRVKSGFPPEDQDGRKLADHQFEWFDEGTWHVEGDVLVTHTNNRPYIKLQESLMDEEQRQRHRYEFEEKTERQRIVSIDDKKMVFDDHSSLDRVHP